MVKDCLIYIKLVRSKFWYVILYSRMIIDNNVIWILNVRNDGLRNFVFR